MCSHARLRMENKQLRGEMALLKFDSKFDRDALLLVVAERDKALNELQALALVASEQKNQLDEARGVHGLALEAWAWMAGTHPMIGSATTASDRLMKAETLLSTAVNWEGSEYDQPMAWLSEAALPIKEAKP